MRVTERLAAALAALACVGAAPLDGGYVRLDRGVARPAPKPDGAVLVYYGASWCGPCRAFLPELAGAYPRLRKQGVEILFVADEGCAGAIDYARTMRMRWLLLPCDPARAARLRRLGGARLPGLILMDRHGRVAISSWRSDGSSAPRAALSRIVAKDR